MGAVVPLRKPCPFCEIVAMERPSEKSLVLVDLGDSVVFLPKHRSTPRHFLVVPKEHYEDLNALPSHATALMGMFLQSVVSAARYLHLKAYRVQINVPGDVRHLHFHLLGVGNANTHGHQRA